jgi:phthalate 4,5-dioxygenase oxygenase subunit
MLTREENELLCRVGPGTPMGEMLREYWIPALRSARLEADGAPVRTRLLGENFVAFRATDGRVGLFDEGCPHRCTSLALARNEDNALTCIFHGWKIDVSGKVVDVPSEPPERRQEFAAKVRVRHYPVREAGGIVWAYLGKRAEPPRFPDFEFTHLPADHVYARIAIVHSNWLQGLEGQVDSAHVGIMHASWSTNPRYARPGRQTANLGLAAVNTGPVFEIIPKPYGFREGALRDLADGTVYARIREVVLPFYSFIPTDAGGRCGIVASLPIDDEWKGQWYIAYNPHRPLTAEDYAAADAGTSGDPNNFASDIGSWDTMWGQDRRAMKEGHWTGIVRCVPFEDFAAEESMGRIVDRSREYLGSSDTPIIRLRRMLLKSVRDFQKGLSPFGMDPDIDYSRIRALAIRYRKEQDWRELDSFNPIPNATPEAARTGK